MVPEINAADMHLRLQYMFTTTRVGTHWTGCRGKRGVEKAWDSAVKKACQHYLFYWFNSKGFPLKLYVALAGSIENIATNKKWFPKKCFHLFIFYFHLLPPSSGFAWIIVKVSSSLWVTIMVRLSTTLSPKPSMALRRANSSSTGTTVDIIHRRRRFWVWQVMPMQRVFFKKKTT